VEHFWVNHSAQPRDWIDSQWGRIEEHIPRGLSGRTVEQRAVLTSYIRTAQWWRQGGTHSRWSRFCAAAAEWLNATIAQRARLQERIHPVAWSTTTERQAERKAEKTADTQSREPGATSGIVAAAEKISLAQQKEAAEAVSAAQALQAAQPKDAAEALSAAQALQASQKKRIEEGIPAGAHSSTSPG